MLNEKAENQVGENIFYKRAFRLFAFFVLWTATVFTPMLFYQLEMLSFRFGFDDKVDSGDLLMALPFSPHVMLGFVGVLGGIYFSYVLLNSWGRLGKYLGLLVGFVLINSLAFMMFFGCMLYYDGPGCGFGIIGLLIPLGYGLIFLLVWFVLYLINSFNHKKAVRFLVYIGTIIAGLVVLFQVLVGLVGVANDLDLVSQGSGRARVFDHLI